MTRLLGARSGRRRENPTPVRRGGIANQIRKEDAPCCQEQRDSLGRLPIGFCGPFCVRRIIRDNA